MNKKYWIWLSLALGAGVRTDEILSAYPDPEKLYQASKTERMLSGVFSKRQYEKLNETKLSDAERIISVCEKNGWNIVTPNDIIYPAGLRNLIDMPLVLYVDGSINCLREKIIIGVVGTRNPCYESIVIARRLSADLTYAGAVVVSGGALGIDSAAHEGALEAGGNTVCVLGCGLGTGYLKENEPLRREISKNGALVTEYPPFKGASRYTFPERNRIISGMSHGVLVVEANEKSGSLITARRAAEQSRDVFAIPGSILKTAYNGVNALIKEGAKCVSSARDILESYEFIYPERLNLDAVPDAPISLDNPSKNKNPKVVRKQVVQGLDPDCAAVYNLFGEDSLHPDDICAATGLPLSKVISVLMQLQMKDCIVVDGGKNYRLK